MSARLLEEEACVWSLEEPQGLGWLKLKGRERGESGCGWGLGHMGADCPGSWTILSVLGFRKEGALNKSQTWLSQMS